MITTAYERQTPFEIVVLQEHANGWKLVCRDRAGAAGSPDVRLHVPDAALTQQEHDVVIAAFTILENAFAKVFDEWAAEPARNKELVAKAADAENRLQAAKLEAQRLELEATVAREEQATILAMNQAESVRIGMVAASRARELQALDAELAAKREEHAAMVASLTAIPVAAPTVETATEPSAEVADMPPPTEPDPLAATREAEAAARRAREAYADHAEKVKRVEEMDRQRDARIAARNATTETPTDPTTDST